jgi:formylglycine-generating enzyme
MSAAPFDGRHIRFLPGATFSGSKIMVLLKHGWPFRVVVVAVWLTRAANTSAAVTIDYVPIGNPGNAGDVQSQGTFGSVPSAYAISRHEVTNGQYTEFLNAADATGANVLGLYSSTMSSSPLGGINFAAGNANGSKYSVKGGQGNNPVMFVTWYDSVRFANWLHNGQGSGSTESGAYTLVGGTPTPSNGNGITRNGGATVFLPSENEWYKAAYYDPAKPGGGGYWDYPTRTDATPFSDQPPGNGAPSPSNTANFRKDDGIANGYDDGYAVTGSPTLVTTQNYATDVGAYPSSLSGYGTLDQGGNVFEWNETLVTGTTRGLRGAGFADDAAFLGASMRSNLGPTSETSALGFRVASVPEPAHLSGILVAAAALLRRRRQPWRQPAPAGVPTVQI